MKTTTTKLRLIFCGLIAIAILAIAPLSVSAKVVDDDPITDQRWVISEIYLGKDDYEGAYLEIYNNDEHTALGWKDFVINLPFNVDLPPISDLHTYKTHAYKTLPLDEGWMGWLAKKYIEVMYGSEIFYEIQDALDEQDNYAYQRCQTTLDDGSRVLSNKFYYGKKTPGKALDCDDKTTTLSNPADLPEAGLCTKLKLNEIGSYLDEEEQFIEIVNSGNDVVNLSNCYVAKSKDDDADHLQLEDYDLEPGGIYSFTVEDTDIAPLTKTSGIIYLIDSDDETVVNYKRYSSAKKDTSTALNEDGEWKTTYTITPGEDNIIDEYPACDEGYYRDKDTHKCRKESTKKDTTSDDGNSNGDDDTTDSSGLKPCKDGYERNPETNRCRKITTDDDDDSSSTLTPCKDGYVRNPATNRCIKDTSSTSSSSSSTLTPCKDGYERNPTTNRCVKKKTSTTSTLTPCKEGYERNPETNRCRKVTTSDGSSTNSSSSNDEVAKFPVATTAKTSTGVSASSNTQTMLIILGIIIVGSTAILIWQYRQELGRSLGKIKAKFNKSKSKQVANSATREKLAQPGADDSASEWMDKLTSSD